MRDGEALAAAWEMVAQWGALIAELPLEAWIADLRSMDTIAPILDPTLYREYIYSGRREALLGMLEGALVFKNAILEARKHVLGHPQLRSQIPKSLPKDGADRSPNASPEAEKQ